MSTSLRLCLLTVCALSLSLMPASCSPQAPRDQAAKTSADGNAGSDYQVIMWVLGGIPQNQDLYFQRLREAGVTAIHISPGDSPDPALSHGFGYYVENIHRIAYLHSRRKLYQADWDGYTKTHDKKYLIRNPCLHDPAYLAEAKRDIQSKIRPYAHRGPLLYDLGDECSITSFASPFDYCFSDHTLAAFRQWLKQQYGTLEALNDEWQTDFKSWDQVEPMTTYEIKDRERGKTVAASRPGADRENYSPWADHRTFMDITFADSWRKFRSWVREVDPKTPVGLEGLQMPAAFGGYDLWRLSQVLDWAEPYDIGNSHAIWRSFLPPGTPIYCTVFEHDPKQASRRLWHLLLNGDHGCIIWASSEWFDYKSPDLTPKPWVEGMSKVFAELRGPAAKKIMHAQRDRAPIAIHYSQPSIQVGWMLDSREDGDTWPRRFSSYEATHSRITRVRNGWTKLIEDLGLQYDFVSTQQILDGVLEQRGYKVLILPQSMAIGDEEAAAIRRYVESGGAVIADFLTGTFDEHGKRRRQAGALDALFGVSRDPDGMIHQPEHTPALVREGASYRWQPAERNLRSALSSSNHPAINVHGRPGGRGQTWYLNLSPIDYPKLRLEGKGGELRDLIGGIFKQAGVKPVVAVTTPEGGPPVGCEVIAYRGEGARYLAVMRNPEYAASSLGELGYGDNSRFEKPEQFVVHLPKAAQVRDMSSGRTWKAKDITVTVDPWKPTLLQLE